MEKELEKTLAIVKPDGMKNIEYIIEMIYKSGLKITDYKVETLDKETLEEHYAHIVNEKFYPNVEQYMTSGPVAIMVLEGVNAVEKFRDLMGPTDSREAGPNTIRGKYGIDKGTNAVHGSDSPKNAEIEINRFFRENVKKLIKKEV